MPGKNKKFCVRLTISPQKKGGGKRRRRRRREKKEEEVEEEEDDEEALSKEPLPHILIQSTPALTAPPITKTSV